MGSRVKSIGEASAYRIDGKSLVVLQVNCRTVDNNAIELWSVVVIDTESWLEKDISNIEVFRVEFTTFRRDRSARGDGGFVCVKNIIHNIRGKLWVFTELQMRICWRLKD